MSGQNMWKSALVSLRSRFESGAGKYSGIRCFLSRESYDSGDPPLAAALSKNMATSEALRPLIGHQADGINTYHAGWIASQEVVHHWWFVHESLQRAVSNAKHLPDCGPEIYAASEKAIDCEQEFIEIADEAGQLLEDVPSVSYKELELLLDTPKLSYNHTLWIVALFCIARQQPLGTSLHLSLITPDIPGVNARAAICAGEIPDSVIQKLECNPFSASVALIDLLMEKGIEKDGPCGTYQWRHNGQVLQERMSPAAWKMVQFLWIQPEHKATFDGLKVPVYQDPEHIADSNAFGSLRREANKFFKKQAVPYQVSIKKTTVFLKQTE